MLVLFICYIPHSRISLRSFLWGVSDLDKGGLTISLCRVIRLAEGNSVKQSPTGQEDSTTWAGGRGSTPSSFTAFIPFFKFFRFGDPDRKQRVASLVDPSPVIDPLGMGAGVPRAAVSSPDRDGP